VGLDCLLYTSGTTGDPKGAVSAIAAPTSAQLAIRVTFKLDHESRTCGSLPMFHCSGGTFHLGGDGGGRHARCLRHGRPTHLRTPFPSTRDARAGAPIVLNRWARAGRSQAAAAGAHQGRGPAAQHRRRSAASAWRNGLRGDVTCTAHRESYGPSTTAHDGGNGPTAGRATLRLMGDRAFPTAHRADDSRRSRTPATVPRDGANMC